MNTTTREPSNERSMNSNDATTTQLPPQANNHHDELRVDQEEVRKPNGEGKTNLPVASDPSKTKLRMVLLVVALVAVVAASAYYLEFVAPYESTDDAFIEAHVTPIAPEVAGRVAQLFVQDNQEVKQGDVLLQIDPSNYQTKLDQVRAGLAAAKSQLAQVNAQFMVDQAKVEQEKANIVVAESEAKQAEADNKRYQAVGSF